MAKQKTLQIKTPAWAVPLFKPARYKGVHSGRGAGKSQLFAEMIVEAHVMNPNHRTVCVREIQKSLNQSVKKLIEDKIEQLGVSDYFIVQDTKILNKYGSGMILFQGLQSHTADSIKSLEGIDVAWVEEAQSLSQRSLDMLRPTIRKPGSEIWFSWNPYMETDPVDVLLRGSNPPPDSIVIETCYTENPWLPDTLLEEANYDMKRDPDKYAHVWLGKYATNSESRIFKNWSIDEFEAPKDAIHYFGMDFGFSADPSTCVRCHIVGRNLYIDYEEYQHNVEIVDLPVFISQIPLSEKYPLIADSSRPETISHLRKNGYPKVMASVKGANSVIEGIEFLKSYDIIVHPRCKHMIDELTLYSYKTDKLTGNITPHIEDKNNHLIDALRYAVEAVRRGIKNIQPSPIQNFTPMPTISRW